MTWEGAGAEDVDAAIVQVLEPALLAVEGVESSTATSTEGRASITLDFEPGYDMGRAADDVQAAVDAVTTLPEEAEDPDVTRGAWRDRVTDVVITGPVGPAQLGLFADEFVTRLFAEGVTRTTIRGVAAPRTVIEVPSVNLIAHDISFAQIAAAIAEEVDADPAGDVEGANARVRTGVEKRSIDQIALKTLFELEDADLAKSWSFYDYVCRKEGKAGQEWLRAAGECSRNRQTFLQKWREAAASILTVSPGEAFRSLEERWRSYASTEQSTD